MNNKILLVSSSFEELNLMGSSKRLSKGSQTLELSHYPLSLAYLHSALEKEGYNVDSLFLNNFSYEECSNIVMNKVDSDKPNFVGFQMLTNNRISSFRLIENIHQKYPSTHLLIGGVHATVMYEQIIKKYPYVISIIGEGEKTILDLAKGLGKKNFEMEKIDGIAFNKNGQVIKTRPRAPIENLDEIPWPKHETFFQNNKRHTGCILTTRGCPFKCSFCCLDAISNRRVRFRSIKNVVDEIDWLVNKYPQIGKIWIQDDSFFINNQRVIEFCDEVIKRKLNRLKFICSARVKPISQELVNKLVEANFYKVFLGLETANEEMLIKCHKGITQEDVIKAYTLFAKTKIITRMFLIVGLPGETIDTVWDTINFTKKIQKIKYLHFSEGFPILMVFPGTEVYDIAKAGGILNDDYWLTDKPTPPYTLEHSYEELLEYKEVMLNNLSLDRAISTWTGFKAQFTMMPRIIKYIFQNRLLVHSFSALTRSILPEKGFLAVKKLYNKYKNYKLIGSYTEK